MISPLDTILHAIEPLDSKAMAAARQRQDSLTKPHGSLGELEELSIKIAGIKADPLPRLETPCLILLVSVE